MKRLHLSFYLHGNSLLTSSREEAVNYNGDTGKENHKTGFPFGKDHGAAKCVLALW